MREALLQFATNGTGGTLNDSSFMGGVQRTYFFNFIDQGSGIGNNNGQNYGFLDYTLTPRPVYYAFKNLITKLQDTSNPFTPISLQYTLLSGTGGALPSTVQHLLLQKHDHSWRLFLWLETAATESQSPPVQQSQTIAFSSPTSFSAVTQYAWGDTGNFTTTPITESGGTYTFTISDHVTELNLAP